MPWTPNQAKGHTHAASTPEKSALWAGTANGVLKDSGDEGKAIRVANAQVNGTINHHHKKPKSKLSKVMRPMQPKKSMAVASPAMQTWAPQDLPAGRPSRGDPSA